jgi:hypothetical protein
MESGMTTTLKDAADDAGFITALMALPEFANKVYDKTTADTSFVKTDGSNIGTRTDKGKALVDVLVPALATVGSDDTKKVYTKTTADTAFVKTLGLTDTIKTEVAKQSVVDALVPALATVGSDDAKKVYTKTTADTAFVKTLDLATKAVAEKVLGAKDGDKSILVEKLGVFLNTDNQEYEGKTAKVFLGEKGLQGPAGTPGTSPEADAVATKLLTGDNKNTLATEVAGKEVLQTAVAGKTELQTAVTNALKSDTAFKTAVKGADGPSGKDGAPGPAGIGSSAGADPSAVAAQLLTDTNKDTLAIAVAGKEVLQKAVAVVPALQAHVAKINIQSPEFQNAVRDTMSQPVFEIPADESAPLSWDWI